MDMSAVERHDRVVQELVATLQGTLDAGAKHAELMVIGQSFLVGLCLLCVRVGGDDRALDVMIKGARHRLAERRMQEEMEKK